MQHELQMNVYEISRHFITDHATILGPTLEKRYLGLVRARDFRKLASVSGDLDMHSDNVHVVRTVRQLEAFFKKNADFAVDEEVTAAATYSFNRGEKLCRITNRRLDHYYSHPDRMDGDMRFYMARAESYIKRILGSFDCFLEEIPSLLRITSGASASSSRKNSLPFQKLRRTVDCTPGCEPYLRAAYQIFGYAAPRVKHTLWNRLEQVPKSWKTNRMIACEPTGNVPFQLCFDTWTKKRLRRYTGINLSNQETNQAHAKQGSLDGSLATVDLSMASDTLSLSLVAWLLPIDWYNYLRDLRAPLYRVNGKDSRYAKFSSMGNGCTFALETLVFASALHAVGSVKGVAYGDDLTIETELYPELIRVLRFMGFVPNEEKSFHSGPFRESCGFDYFNGTCITPFYIRSTAPWDKPNDCHNVNGLFELSPYGALGGYLAEFTRRKHLPLIPLDLDSTRGVFIHPSVAYAHNLIRRNKRGFLEVKGLVRKNVAVTCRDSRALALWFLNRPRCANDDGIESSRYTTSSDKYVRKWVTWNYPGPGDADLFGGSQRFFP